MSLAFRVSGLGIRSSLQNYTDGTAGPQYGPLILGPIYTYNVFCRTLQTQSRAPDYPGNR